MLRVRRKSFVLSEHLAHNTCALPADGHYAEQEHRKKASRMSSHSMRETSSLRNALRTLPIID